MKIEIEDNDVGQKVLGHGGLEIEIVQEKGTLLYPTVYQSDDCLKLIQGRLNNFSSSSFTSLCFGIGGMCELKIKMSIV